MCDTLVAIQTATADGEIIFGKNSDRPSDEVQLITYNPHKKYNNQEQLHCTYITIPQVKETAAILLSQPWWMWGAEIGCNEYDVVIGNEAVHTYEPLRNQGLLGMDLLRLGLERGKTAIKALYIITELLEKYHQGGGCAYNDPGWMYHNSFLIADPKEAYVLETADDWWIAEKVKNARSISNGLTIRRKGDLRRKGIIQHAIEKGFCKGERDFDFAITFSGSSPSTSPYSRKGRTEQLLQNNAGKITDRLMMDFLRDHQAGICMHGGFESTGSQVSVLKEDSKSIHWFTGTTLPCLSIYKPYIFPINHQRFEKPGPYQKKKNQWKWISHSNYLQLLRSAAGKKELQKYIDKKEEIESNIYLRVKRLSQQEKTLTNKEFNEQFFAIHDDAYNKAHLLIA
ncbi:MAG: Peptidase family C69 [Promethearchaeota archaeon]|nr:MAG: Peptidase family C69 [Candidatus Lokiarchaeota archaeon]